MAVLKFIPLKIYYWFVAIRLRYLVARIRDRLRTLAEMHAPGRV